MSRSISLSLLVVVFVITCMCVTTAFASSRTTTTSLSASSSSSSTIRTAQPPVYSTDNITANIEFVLLNGTSVGNYLFRYSQTLDVGLFQRNGPYMNGGPNTISWQLRNFSASLQFTVELGLAGSCSQSQGSNDLLSDITNNLGLLQQDATYGGQAMIGAYVCDKWDFTWSNNNQSASTYVRKTDAGAYVPVYTLFHSALGGAAYYSTYSDAPIDPRDLMLYKYPPYSPCVNDRVRDVAHSTSGTHKGGNHPLTITTTATTTTATTTTATATTKAATTTASVLSGGGVSSASDWVARHMRVPQFL